jgi:hypothetical protein
MTDAISEAGCPPKIQYVTARKHFVKMQKLNKIIKREGCKIAYRKCSLQILGWTSEILTRFVVCFFSPSAIIQG